MQGAESEESIVRALETVADALDDFDAVVLIRGGGSQSDLGGFDSYRLCCHLAQFPLPVIAGIGHDKDRSVADLVAAVSLKTPTAVAVYLKNKMAEFEALLDSLRGRLAEWAEEMLGGCTTFLRERAMRLEQQTMRLVHECSLGLQRTGAELGHRATEAVRRERAIGSERCVPESLRLPVSLWRITGSGARQIFALDAAPSQLRFPIRASPRTHADGRSGRFARSPGGYWRWAFRWFARKAGRWPIRSRCIRATGSRSRRIPARSKRKSIKSNQYDTSEINLHAGRRGSGANPRKVQRRADERRLAGRRSSAPPS